MQFPAPPVPPDVPPSVIVDTGTAWGEIYPAVVISAFIIGMVFLLLPLVRAWARRIEGRNDDPMMMEELSGLRERVADIDHLNARVHELEERLDFAERLLVQRDASALPRGEGQS